MIYGIPAVINLGLVKTLFKSNRVNGQIIIAQSLKKIYTSVIDLYKYMFNLLPKNVFIFAILFTFTVFCCKIWKEQKKALRLFKFCYIIIGVTFVAVAPMLVEATESIWFVPRAIYCFASLYGILILYIASSYELRNISKIAIVLVSIVLMLLQLQKFYQIEKDRYIINQKDEQITFQIIDKIKKYELSTGNIISEIEVYNDEKPNYTYSGVFAFGDTNVKCYANDWSTVQVLNYYLKRNLELKQKNETTSKDFAKKNWDDFNIEEQVVFKDNTVIICNY